MGYNTDFDGVLKFKPGVTIPQLAKVKSFCGEDPSDHPDWILPKNYSYINLKITDDFSGLEWNGSEKTYHMEEAVNIIIDTMRREYPDFGLTGSLIAQGEEIRDRWKLIIDDEGRAARKELVLEGNIIKCPHCDGEFILELKQKKGASDGKTDV